MRSILSITTMLVLTALLTACRSPLEPWELPRTALPDVVSLTPDIEHAFQSREASGVDYSTIDANGRLGFRGGAFSLSDPLSGYFVWTHEVDTPEIWFTPVVEIGDVDQDGLSEWASTNGGFGDRTESVVAPGWDDQDSLYLPYATASFQQADTCGDLNRDGFADLCTDRYVDFGPLDGVFEYQWPDAAARPTGDGGGRIADVDADGTFEYYLIEGAPRGTRVRTLDDTWSFAPEGTIDRPIRPQNPHRSPGVLYLTGRLGAADVLWRLTAEQLAANEPPDVLPIDGKTVAIGDFRGDGTHQVITSRGNRLIAREPDGTPIAWFEPVFLGFREGPEDTLDAGTALAVGDHDGDGVDDLVVESHARDWIDRSYVQVYFAPLAGM